MNHTYRYAAAATALTLALGGVPATLVHAEDGQDDAVTANAVVSARVDDDVEVRARASASTTVQEKDRERQQEVLEMRSQNNDENEDRGNATSSAMRERNLAAFAARFGLDLTATATPALSAEQLKQAIEKRKHELEDEEASTTPEFKEVVRNANEVRLAVHVLLASRDLLGGGIGDRVSEIARQMNESVATTTAAEAQIQSRNIIARVLFGGDKKSAEALKEQVAKNQEQIAALTETLAQANVSADVKATLEAQVTALTNAQVRLEALASAESKKWGILSWLFN